MVLPGFVDAHAHPVFAGNRLDDFERRARGETYEQIAAAGGGIWSTVEKTRAASDVDLLTQATRHARWFLGCGTTTVEAKSGYGLTVEDELKILSVIRRLNQETPLEIVPTFLGAHAVPREMRADKYVNCVIQEMLPQVVSERLAEFCDVFCECGYFDVEQSREILSAAKKLGLKLRIHADQLTNSGGAKLAAELKATTADHLEKTDVQGIAGLGLRAWVGRLSACTRNDRGGARCCYCNRFQSWFVADAKHANDPFAGVHTNENVAGGSVDGIDN